EASNIWNDFKNGRIVPGQAGMLSDELLGIARISKDSNMSPGDAANLIALGKVQRDSGVDLEVLSKVSLQMKGLDEMEQVNMMNTLMDIQKIKKPGESVLEAEKRFLNEKKEAERAEKNRVEIQSAIEELNEKKENLSQEISLGMEVSRITGLKDEKNVAAIIKAVRGFSTKDDFLYMVKVFDSAMREGVSADDMVMNAKIIEEAEKLGFSIPVLKQFIESMNSEELDFTELLDEIKALIKDKRVYENAVKDLSTQLDSMEKEKESAEKIVADFKITLNKLNDDILKKQELKASLDEEMIAINEKIKNNRDELARLENQIDFGKKDLERILNGTEYASRGISTLNQLEEKIREYESKTNQMQNRISELQKEEREKRDKIDLSQAFYDLMVYASDDDRSGLKLAAEDILRNIMETKIPTRGIRTKAISTLMNIANTEIPVAVDYTNAKMKIISVEQYKKLEEDSRMLKQMEEKYRKIVDKMDSWGNDVRKYIASQLQSPNPDLTVKEAIRGEAAKIMAESSKETIERRINDFSNALMMSTLAFKGYKVDHPLYLDIWDHEKLIRKRLEFKISDVAESIRDKKMMVFPGFEIEPLKIIEGFIVGGLIMEKGKFYRHDSFFRIGKRPVLSSPVGS
ncbi:MAG: hypothetical protein ACP5RE_04035, partial [Candidatus Acidifodinimicrobium sp.]